VFARDFLSETIQQRGRQSKRLKRVRLVSTGNPVVNLARRHELNRATREQQGFPTERLTLHPAGNECDMAVEMVVRFKAKLGKPSRTKERVRNNFPKWAWRVQSDAGKMRSFGRIDDAGWLPG
jgi:hypothetical protein